MDAIAGQVDAYLARLTAAVAAVDRAAVQRAAAALLDAHRRGGIVYLCGNGGSAATASHMASDLAKGAPTGPVTGLRTHALTDNVPLITAWANDLDYAGVFSEQIRTLVRAGDALVAISASGNSPNIVRAVEQARTQGALTIGLSGFGGGRLAELADVSVIVPSHEYGPVEDVHLALGHAIATALRAVQGAAANGVRREG